MKHELTKKTQKKPPRKPEKKAFYSNTSNHTQGILISKKNWKVNFEEKFKKKDILLRYFRYFVLDCLSVHVC